ncbi:MAG: phage major tail tube protein [Shimia sp.]
MQQYPYKYRNHAVFHDGLNYVGDAMEVTPPVPTIQEADHRAAGMDGVAPVDMGLEKMTASAKFTSWGAALVTLLGTRDRMTFRPAHAKVGGMEDAVGYVMTIGGLWTKTDFGELKPGNDAPMTLTCSVDFYKLEREGEELFHIDVEAGIRRINGTDQVAAIREAMGY